ncbi:MAG TPA: hypothetical protein VIX19_11110 [Terriglobales bacterium]
MPAGPEPGAEGLALAEDGLALRLVSPAGVAVASGFALAVGAATQVLTMVVVGVGFGVGAVLPTGTEVPPVVVPVCPGADWLGVAVWLGLVVGDWLGVVVVF